MHPGQRSVVLLLHGTDPAPAVSPCLSMGLGVAGGGHPGSASR